MHKNQSDITSTVAVGPLESISTKPVRSDTLRAPVGLDSRKSDHHFSGPSSSEGSYTHNKKFLPAADSPRSNTAELSSDEEDAFFNTIDMYRKAQSRWDNDEGESENLGPFRCDMVGCGKLFVGEEHLQQHVRNIHGHQKRESSPGPTHITRSSFQLLILLARTMQNYSMTKEQARTWGTLDVV